MKTMKTSDLTGAALDWAVAKCEGVRLSGASLSYQVETHGTVSRGSAPYAPSQDWGIAGPIIEREWLDVTPWPNESEESYRWQCRQHDSIDTCAFGQTPLVAAMRCHVASKMGDVVEVPNELLSKDGYA